ncbi:alpha/beta hydrolase [Sphingomonas sp.]|uniref:alpha/beta hydrolase n=1 Tax=Sphingomonas sp. TaxID=28214 RepID=UPI002C6858FB|nr:alpha/beta hydrolase-fold protein [Sphingomonas sp.]HWK35487.1 alpha/beta hydrolase-fold protein [Sphingomonas sp.]
MIGDSFGPDWRREPRTGFHLRRYDLDGAAYDVAVAVPEGPEPAQGFPLLVVMDGAIHFDAVAAAAAALARRPGKTEVGSSVVVGIASGAGWSHDPALRERDLLPDGAGCDALHRLLGTRVLPDVAALAPVDPARRALFGHSFGGVFALDALARDFSTCIAVSPSLWRAPDLAARVAAAIAGRDVRVLIAWGAREPQGDADLPAAIDTLAAAGARVTHATIADEDHGSVPFAVLPMALRFVHGVTR